MESAWTLLPQQHYTVDAGPSAEQARAVTIDGQACPVKASRTVRATLWAAAVLTVAIVLLPPILR